MSPNHSEICVSIFSRKLDILISEQTVRFGAPFGVYFTSFEIEVSVTVQNLYIQIFQVYKVRFSLICVE